MSTAQGTEARVCADIAARQQLGIEKYGTTVADNPLALRDWLQHAYEETLDKAVYLKRAIEEIDGRKKADRQIARIIKPDAKCAPLQRMIVRKGGVSWDDIKGRDIICTPSLANYGRCSYWIISLNGSPPRGTIMHDTFSHEPSFLIVDKDLDYLRGKDYQIVKRFVEEFLENA